MTVPAGMARVRRCGAGATHGLVLAFLMTILCGCETLAMRTPAPRAGAGDVAGLEARADRAYRDEDWKAAEEAYTRLTALAPEHAEHWFRRANACARLNRIGEAVRLYGEALRREPGHAGAWHNLGMAQLQLAVRSFAELETRAGDDEAARRRARRIIDGVTSLLAAERALPEAADLELESLKIQ
jgi:tetratricopeptide (TPR) repeat protein